MALRIFAAVWALTWLQACSGLRTASRINQTESEAYVFMHYGEESYEAGLMTAIHNLREFDKVRPVVVLTPDKPTQDMVGTLALVNATVLQRPAIHGPAYCNGDYGEGKERLADSFFKLHVWNLTQFSTVLYLESDMLFRAPLEELFQRFSKVPQSEAVMIAPQGSHKCTDRGFNGDFKPTRASRRWNTGIIAIRPSAVFADLYNDALHWRSRKAPCQGGSQILENILFKDYLQSEKTGAPALICMPLKYNCKDPSCGWGAKVVHWTGERKPWDGGGDFTTFLSEWEKKRDSAQAFISMARLSLKETAAAVSNTEAKVKEESAPAATSNITAKAEQESAPAAASNATAKAAEEPAPAAASNVAAKAEEESAPAAVSNAAAKVEEAKAAEEGPGQNISQPNVNASRI